MTTPLDFLRSIYMDEDVPLHTRMKAATEAAAYVHPKLSAVLVGNGGDKFAEMLDAAIARSRAAQAQAPQPKLIEPPKLEPLPVEGSKPPPHPFIPPTS